MNFLNLEGREYLDAEEFTRELLRDFVGLDQMFLGFFIDITDFVADFDGARFGVVDDAGKLAFNSGHEVTDATHQAVLGGEEFVALAKLTFESAYVVAHGGDLGGAVGPWCGTTGLAADEAKA